MTSAVVATVAGVEDSVAIVRLGLVVESSGLVLFCLGDDDGR